MAVAKRTSLILCFGLKGGSGGAPRCAAPPCAAAPLLSPCAAPATLLTIACAGNPSENVSEDVSRIRGLFGNGHENG